MSKKRKLTKQQEANKREYNKLRDNLKRREKRLYDKGYYVKPEYKDKVYLPTVTELGHNPRKSDIERLKNISSSVLDKAFHKTFYSPSGEQKDFPLSKAKNIERTASAKKAAATRRFYNKYPQFKEAEKKRKNIEQFLKNIGVKNNGYTDDYYTPVVETNFEEQQSEEPYEPKTEDEMYEDISVKKVDDGYEVYKGNELFEPAVDENDEIIGFFQGLNDLPFSDEEDDEYSEETHDTESATEFPSQYQLPMADDISDTEDSFRAMSEEDMIVNNVDEILNDMEFTISKLFGFRSIANNKSKAKENEDFVFDKASTILDKFLEIAGTDRNTLARNCQMYAMQINSLLESVKMAYRDPRTFEAIFTDLTNYFMGNVDMSESMAKDISQDTDYETGGEYIYD